MGTFCGHLLQSLVSRSVEVFKMIKMTSLLVVLVVALVLAGISEAQEAAAAAAAGGGDAAAAGGGDAAAGGGEETKKPTYQCMEGLKSLVESYRDSFYCWKRIGWNGWDKEEWQFDSEQKLIDACNERPECTGYDWRHKRYGHLCKQADYPGDSPTCCSFKLCKKVAN